MHDRMPLYPDEKAVAVAVMGPARAKDWSAKARHLEDKHGLPRVDELMGGRYWPAVAAFFQLRHGLKSDAAIAHAVSSGIQIVPFKPDGKENFDSFTSRPRGRR